MKLLGNREEMRTRMDQHSPFFRGGGVVSIVLISIMYFVTYVLLIPRENVSS